VRGQIQAIRAAAIQRFIGAGLISKTQGHARRATVISARSGRRGRAALPRGAG